ncbi:MAG: UDP-N-acetylmuramate dehydrogenase [Vicinamibacterales bacterium]
MIRFQESALHGALAGIVGVDSVCARAPLAHFTTFGIGGPADWLVEPRGDQQIVALLRLAQGLGLPVTILGGGSNVLVSDRGVRGLVIRPRGGTAREESPGEIRADAALTMNGLVRWTIARGCQGLEAWAGTPGTVGGAIYGNAHFAGRTIDELVVSVRLSSRGGEVSDVPRDELGFAYDRSRLHETREVLLSASFRVRPGADPASLRAVARESLAYRKRTQPLGAPSAGCIFRNPPAASLPPGVPTSAGALVDLAGMKGCRLGGARVSPLHANFIVNEGGATAASVRELVEKCREAVLARFGVRLQEEIVYIGDWGQ